MTTDQNADQPGHPGDGPSFEASLDELERIVADLEDGTLGLEECLVRYEKGIGLLRRCYQVLEQIEQKIEILSGTDSAGNPVAAPFDSSASHDGSQRKAGRRQKKKPEPESATETQTPCEPELPPKLFHD